MTTQHGLLPGSPAWNNLGEALGDVARRTPECVALRDRSGTMTYGEFDERAGSLAAALLEALGGRTGPDAPVVPVLVGRDRWSALAVHAVVRAGLPLCTLDIDLPAAERDRRWERLGCAPVVLVGPEVAAVTLPGTVTVLRSDRGVDRPLAPQPVDPGGIAAVVFSSGSTGRAKGVVLGRDVFHELERQVAGRGLGDAGDVTVSPMIHIGGLRRTLAIALGRSLEIIDPTLLGADELIDRLAATGLDELSIVTSLARLTAGASGRRRLSHVRTVTVGGEPLSWACATALLRQIAPGGRVVNHLSASETPTGGLFGHAVTESDPEGTGFVPLGEPLSSERVRLEPVGDPADGLVELVVRGVVARGYLDDPDQTATRFGFDPDGTRWWRSGDLLARLPEGGYRHVGRADDLVKINGKLTEPAITQHLLEALPGVGRAVVLPQPAPSGATRLVAHLELQPGATIGPGDIQAHLASELPAHQRPAVLVRHARLPLNANAKIDRRTLQDRPPSAWQDEAPTEAIDAVDTFALERCSTVLGIAGLGMNSNLWAMGLDSMSAVELAAAFDDASWYGLQPSELLTAVTPGQIAERLRDATAPAGSRVVHLHPSGSRPPLFCIPGAGGTALRFGWLAGRLGSDQPMIVIEARGLQTDLPIDRTVEAMAASALEVVRNTRPTGPLVLAGHSAGGLVAHEMAQTLHDEGREVSVILFDIRLRRHQARLAARDRTPRQRLHARRPTALLDGLRRRAEHRNALRGLDAPIGSAARYRAFVVLGRRAAARYVPRPGKFPVTLCHVPGGGGDQLWPQYAPRLDVIDCPGDHFTMLEPPHVDALAAHVTRLLGETHPPAFSGRPVPS